MNESVYLVSSIISFIVCAFALICTLLLDRRTKNRVADLIDRAEETNRESESAINDARDTSQRLAESVTDCKESVGRIKQGVDRSEEIFAEIEKQRISDL